MTERRITLPRIETAAAAIDPVFLHTPQWVCEPLADDLGVRVLLKVEVLNPIRSFEGRGADWLVQNLPHGAEIVCASAGNFGRARAFAARARGAPLIIHAEPGRQTRSKSSACGRRAHLWSWPAPASTRQGNWPGRSGTAQRALQRGQPRPGAG
ncbi:MAG: pyridoxal-phosphate dependent enzyme [Thermomicrobiales bacterium]